MRNKWLMEKITDIRDVILVVCVCVRVCVCVSAEGRYAVYQYWYTSWPDQKTPDKAPPLLELVQEVERAREDAPPTSGPVIVHCR